MAFKRVYANKKKKMKKRVYKKRQYRKKKGMTDFIVKSTPIRTPFPDEFVCKVKSWVTFKMLSQGASDIKADARIDNSLYTLGKYENGTAIVDIQPIGGKWTQEGLAQLGDLYTQYVVMGIRTDLVIENNDDDSLMVYSFPYYPGTNLTGPSVPFTTKVEDDPRVKKQYINPQTQGTSKRTLLKRYLTPDYAYNNGYIKGDKGWSALVNADPSYNYGLGFRVETINRSGYIAGEIVVSGYITHYVKFFNKKGTN